MKYKLIHIDTLEVTMCEKITIDEHDYYVSDNIIPDDEYYISLENDYATEPKTRYVIYNKVGGLNSSNPRKLIATTNPSIKCPQVVDYVEELAESHYGTDIDSYRSSKPFDLEADRKQGFVKGYQKHSETHSLSDEEVLQFIEWSKGLLINKESLEIFKSTLPAKIYYR